ncbi:MAG: aspartate aminotransferase family protein [bacterium]|nr:aspartate aminotransferase family protein [bacterium]
MQEEPSNTDEITRNNDYWVDLDRKYRAQVRKTRPIVLEKGKGAEVWDVEGKKYLDFESGQMAMVAGHSHPAVLKRIREQIELLMQNSIRVLNIPRVLLAKKLSEIVPDPLAKSFFLSTGAESVEAALRLAKKYTGRFEVVALLRGYHGRTAGSQSYTSISRGARTGYGPLLPGSTFIPAPYCYRCAFNETLPCNLSCLSYAEDVIDRTTSGQPAAMLIETMQGVGGTIVPPVDWVRRIRQICNEREMLLIIDESLTGMGRTGKWFGFEYYDIVPDILTTSKALGQGVPVAAVITTGEIADRTVANGFDQGATHMGDSFQCAVALANIEVIERENLLEKSYRMGELLKEGLKELQAKFEVIGDVRGKGLFLGVEIVESRVSRRPDPDSAIKLVTECEDRGLLLGGGIPTGGLGTNTIRLCPPLVITEDQIVTAINIIGDVLPMI